jgi:hypothetical protein
MKQVRATVSGSFTRHLPEIQKAVAQLKQHGARVLSPERPTIVGAMDGFVFVESDRHRSVRLVQDRHLASIANSDFLWLETPDGYVGASAALEVGFAIASSIPVFSTSLPNDLTMRQYVCRVSSLAEAITRTLNDSPEDETSLTLLVDPIAGTEEAARGIENIRKLLVADKHVVAPSRLRDSVEKERKSVLKALALPTA